MFAKKSFYVFAILLFAAVILLGWSQVWFELSSDAFSSQSPTEQITGQSSGPGLIGLSLALFAASGVLALAGRVLARVVASALVLIAAGMLWILLVSLSDPITASQGLLIKLTAIANVEELHATVTVVTVTAWPFVALVAALFVAVLGIALFFVSSRFESRVRKYDISRKNSQSASSSVDATAVEEWDQLNTGIDPTN